MTRKRADGQISGLAGEFFVAAELLKRGVKTSINFGNAESIDLLAHNPETGRAFTVQVKSLRTHSFFPLTRSRVEPDHTYVFVVLNRPGQAVRYFIVPGSLIVDDPGAFWGQPCGHHISRSAPPGSGRI